MRIEDVRTSMCVFVNRPKDENKQFQGMTGVVVAAHSYGQGSVGVVFDLSNFDKAPIYWFRPEELSEAKFRTRLD